MSNKNKDSGVKILALNRKASFNYFLSNFTECGVVLQGTEIKALRAKGCSIGDAYVVFANQEANILNMHIPLYEQGNIFNHEPLRTRKLLLHKKEINFFADRIKTGGYTVVPTKVYFVRGKAKIEIALAKGKKSYDKREAIKERDIKREIMKHGN